MALIKKRKVGQPSKSPKRRRPEPDQEAELDTDIWGASSEEQSDGQDEGAVETAEEKRLRIGASHIFVAFGGFTKLSATRCRRSLLLMVLLDLAAKAYLQQLRAEGGEDSDGGMKFRLQVLLSTFRAPLAAMPSCVC